MKVKWKNDSRKKLKPGMSVKVGNSVRKVERILSDMPGGVMLDRPINNLRYWNMDQLIPV